MTVSWFSGVTLTVEIAFTTDPLDAVPSWTDVSADVRGLSTSAGRSSEFSAFSPSTLSITLSNRTRQYDPEYASSPYVGNLLPMKKIRVRATYSATTYDLFTGYIQGWPQQYEFHFDSTVTIQAVDGSRFLEQSVLPGSAYATEVLADTPAHYWPMQGGAASVFEDLAGDVDISANPYLVAADLGFPLGQTVGVASDPTNPEFPDTGIASYPDSKVVVGSYLPSPPKALELWFRTPVTIEQARAGLISAWAASSVNNFIWIWPTGEGEIGLIYSNTADNRRKISGTTDIPWPSDQVVHVAAAATSTNIYLYVNGVQVYTTALTVGTQSLISEGLSLTLHTSSDDDVPLTVGPAVSHVAVYSTAPSASRWFDHYAAGSTAYGHPYGERSGARIGRVLDAVGWPAADRDLSTGDTVHGPYLPAGGSAMAALRDVETAEDGYVFIDSAGNVVLRDRNWQWTQTATTFSDDGSDTSYDSITIDANSVDPLRSKVSATYRNGDGYLFTEDTAALTAYGPATEALSVPTIDNAVTARGLTAYKLRTMKDPRTRITQINVKPRALPATAFPAVLNLELGDRANVEITPMNLGAQVVKAVTVQGIAHNISVDGVWDTTLYCSPAPELATDVPYLIVGDATYGRIGAAAGNAIPF